MQAILNVTEASNLYEVAAKITQVSQMAFGPVYSYVRDHFKPDGVQIVGLYKEDVLRIAAKLQETREDAKHQHCKKPWLALNDGIRLSIYAKDVEQIRNIVYEIKNILCPKSMLYLRPKLTMPGLRNVTIQAFNFKHGGSAKAYQFMAAEIQVKLGSKVQPGRTKKDLIQHTLYETIRNTEIYGSNIEDVKSKILEADNSK